SGPRQFEAGPVKQRSGGGDAARQHLQNVIELIPQYGFQLDWVVVYLPAQRRQPERLLVYLRNALLWACRCGQVIRFHPDPPLAVGGCHQSRHLGGGCPAIIVSRKSNVPYAGHRRGQCPRLLLPTRSPQVGLEAQALNWRWPVRPTGRGWRNR